MSPAKHSAICAQIQQLHQAKESKLLARIAELEAQRTWVGLTNEEISDLWCKVSNTDFVTADTHVFAEAIEAKLKEKNT